MSTARTDLRTGFATMMAAYNTANPSATIRHFGIRPEHLHDMPCSYLDLPETDNSSSGLHVRDFTPTLTVVAENGPNPQVGTDLDTVVDSLVSFIRSYGGSFGGHITTDSVWSSLTVTDGSETDGDSSFPASRIAFGPISFAEGR